MPLYQFRDTETEEVFSEMMSYNDKLQFLEDNPHIKSVLGAPAIIGGVGGVRNDDGFKEVLSKISEAHPGSNLAAEHGSKSSKEVKTRQAVEKWRKSQNKTTT